MVPWLRLKWILPVVALSLIVGLSTAAVGAHGEDCDTYRLSSIPILHPAVDVGKAQTCDTNRDGTSDTVRFDTQEVNADGEVSITNEQKQRADHQDRETSVETRVSLHTIGGPIVHNEVFLNDEGNDGNPEEVGTEGGLYTTAGRILYITGLNDPNGDGEFDSYSLLACGPEAGCSAPDPSDVPEPPERIVLPPTVFHIEPIGWIP